MLRRGRAKDDGMRVRRLRLADLVTVVAHDEIFDFGDET